MKEENFHKRTAAFLLSFGLVLSQIPAYATVGGEATASEQANPLVAQAGGVKVRATVDDTPSTNNRGPTRHSSIQQAVEEISGAFKANSVSLEGFVDAKILIEALKEAGRDLTRAKFVAALESMHDMD